MKKGILKIVALSLVISMLVPMISYAANGNGYVSTGGSHTYNTYSLEFLGRRLYNDNFLYDNGDNTYTKVELKKQVEIEVYDSNFVRKSVKKLDNELKLSAGFYCGAVYNYIVFGQNNFGESNDVEVIRVVKYDKSWNRIASTSIYGANTNTPFHSGGVEMVEAGDYLFIATCHEMYVSDDGKNHQSNMLIKINTTDMSLNGVRCDISNFSTGYVSHSFAQLIDSDGTDIYTADLGDAYPRAIFVAKKGVEDEVSDQNDWPDIKEGISAYKIDGRIGNNYTGVIPGGMILTNDNIMVSFSSVPMTGTLPSSSYKNVKVMIIPKSFTSEAGTSQVKVVDITNHDPSLGINALEPIISKIDNNKMLLRWVEEDKEKAKYTTNLCVIDALGNNLYGTVSIPMEPSTVQPVVKGQTVIWYGGEGKTPVFYMVDCSTAETFKATTEYIKEPEKGETVTDEKTGAKAKVLDVKKKEVSYIKPKNTKSKNVTIPESISVNGVKYTVTKVNDKAFKNNKYLTKITLPKTIKTIGKEAFRKTLITKIDLSKQSALKTIGDNAFADCKKLKSIKINANKISKIGKNAFKLKTKPTVTVYAKNKKIYDKAVKKLKASGLKQAKFKYKKAK